GITSSSLFLRSLHDALPILDRGLIRQSRGVAVRVVGQVARSQPGGDRVRPTGCGGDGGGGEPVGVVVTVVGDLRGAALEGRDQLDRKSTRLNSSHVKISYAV